MVAVPRFDLNLPLVQVRELQVGGTVMATLWASPV
jgi:hypothetical protein